MLFTLCATQLIVCLFATMVIHAMRIWNRNVIFEKFWESPSQRPFIKCIGLRNFTSCSSQEFFFLAIHQLAPHWLRTPSGQRPHANPELLSFDSHSGKSSFLSVFPQLKGTARTACSVPSRFLGPERSDFFTF